MDPRQADALVDQISPMLSNQAPEIVGAALAQLSAIFLGSHAPPLRAEARRAFYDLIDDLVPIVIEERIADGRLPKEWRGPRRKCH